MKCKQCGGTELIKKVTCSICANCRCVVEYNPTQYKLFVDVTEEKSKVIEKSTDKDNNKGEE